MKRYILLVLILDHFFFVTVVGKASNCKNFLNKYFFSFNHLYIYNKKKSKNFRTVLTFLIQNMSVLKLENDNFFGYEYNPMSVYFLSYKYNKVRYL